MVSNYLFEFATIVREGSIARGAAELGISSSALTRHLDVLERELGERLLDRSSTGVSLTEAGRYALEAGEKIDEIGRKLAQEYPCLADHL